MGPEGRRRDSLAPEGGRVLFVFASISYPPIPIFEVWGLQLSLHGVMAAVGFLVGAQLAVKLAARRGFDAAAFQSILTWALVGAMLGARYLTSPAQIAEGASLIQALNPVGGNFSILGGYAGGVLAGGLQAYRLRQPFLALADSAALGMALGGVVGRIGDIFIVEHLGRATDFFLGYAVKPGYDLAPQHTVLECGPAEAVDGICGIYHHTAMYDMFGSAVLLFVLWQLTKRWKGRHYGQLLGVWVAWYGFQRFLIDFLRIVPEDQGLDAARAADATLGSLTWSQWSGLAGSLFGLFLIWWWGAKSRVVTEAHDRELSEATTGAPSA